MFDSSAVAAMHRNRGMVRVTVECPGGELERHFYVARKCVNFSELDAFLSKRQRTALRRFLARHPNAVIKS